VKATPTCPEAVRALVIDGLPRVTVSVSVAVPVPPALVAPIVTLELPTAVGVPVMSPVAVATLKPAGNPVAVKLVGELLPAIWYENAMPTCPDAVRALVIDGLPKVIVSVSVAVPVPPALVAPIVTLELPTAVGVPVISPVAVAMVSPAGRPVALNDVGVLLAVIW
jgi:hypothetical protein